MFFMKIALRYYFSQCRMRFRSKWVFVKEIHEGGWFFKED